MSKLLNLVVSGMVAGGLYALIGSGLVLTFNATGIFNFGYGAVAFVSAFSYYELHTGLHWPIVAAAGLTLLIIAPLIGLLIDRVVFRTLTAAADAAKVMATVGILVALPALAKWIVALLVNDAHVHIPTGDQVFVAPGIGPEPAKVWHLGDLVNLTSDQLIVFVTATVLAALLWYLLKHTSLGLQMRALVNRPRLAQMRGVDRGRISSLSWVLGTFMAGVVGVIGTPIFNSLTPGTYELLIFIAIAAVVLGRLTSIPWVFAGALAVGVIQNLVAGYATFAKTISGFNASVPFVVLFVGMVLMGKSRGRRGAVVSEEVLSDNYLNALPEWRRLLPWGVAITVLAVYVLEVSDPFWTQIITSGLALGVVFLSYTIVTGVGGMVSLAQGALVTASGLTAGLLMDHFGQNYLVGLLAGVTVATLMGCLVAIPALRLGGLSLALATLALGFVCDEVLFQWNWFRNTYSGWTITPPKWGFIDFSDPHWQACFLILIILAITALIHNLQNSLSGRAIFAVRTTEVGAATSGISPWKTKITIFAFSAFTAGLGGVLLASVNGSAVANAYTTPVGLIWLASVVVWGIRRPGAAVIAGLSFAIFPALLSQGFHWASWVPSALSWNGTKTVWIPNIIFGLGAIQMAKDPDGVISVFGKMRAAKRRAHKASADQTSDGATDHRRVRDVDVVTESMPLPTDAVLSIRALDAGYGPLAVLHDIDLDLQIGQITTLLGANGAGKSTLCGVLSGFVESDGQLVFRDEPIGSLRPDERARRGLIVIPESRGIFPGLTVEENLALTIRDVEMRRSAYDRFPALAARRTVHAGNLSGGEQQMLTLASQLIMPPVLLVADEPTLGLAPLITNEIMRLFSELRERDVTLLLVEEKARHILSISDSVAFIELGRLTWRGIASEVTDQQLRASYLGAAVAEERP